jgi:hypothetical protein
VIKRNINKILATTFATALLLNIVSAQITSPFNKLEVKDSSSNYSFIVSGHFHGASTNSSTFPAASLQANIDTLNSLHPSFLMCLGDMFLDVNETYIEHYQKSLFDKLKMPLFNAVGNHDLANDNMYEKVYGKTFFYFTTASELFIVLNTEVNDGSIKNEQLLLFKDAIQAAASNKIKNVFIFSHRPVWAENIDKYSKLFTDNTHSFSENNFSREIKPLLQAIPNNKSVYWISGSMGGSAPVSFFYDKNEELHVTFMQTAIRDLPRDAALQVGVKNGIVSFNGISFTGQKLEPIENYNISYWSKTISPEQKFNYRLLPFLTLQMIRHYYFWIGFTLSIFLMLIVKFIMKRWIKRK